MASAKKRVPQGASGDEKTTAKCTLFVRNLPYEATNEGLEEVFSEIGPMKSCFVVRDKGKQVVLLDMSCLQNSTDLQELAIYSTRQIKVLKLHASFACCHRINFL